MSGISAFIGTSELLDLRPSGRNLGGRLGLVATMSAGMAGCGVADGAASGAHRAFMCGKGLVGSTGMRTTFVAAQCMLLACYCSADALEAAVYATLGAESTRYDVLTSETYTHVLKRATHRRLSLLKWEHGHWRRSQRSLRRRAFGGIRRGRPRSARLSTPRLSLCAYPQFWRAYWSLDRCLTIRTTKIMFRAASPVHATTSIYRYRIGGG